jgi:class 3 adenylate cyclase
MSVGLHSGSTHFFLVGGSHRELVLLGPAANEVVAAEGTAEAGEILVSEAMEALLPANSTRQRADGQRLLRWRKPVLKPCGARSRPKGAEAASLGLFPEELGRHLAPGTPDPEHRVACISFIRFSGTDKLLEQRGPEVVAAALDKTLGDIQAVLVDEGVTLLAVDLDRDGGKLFMAAGIPQAHEDDPIRAIKTAREIHQLMNVISPDVEKKIGQSISMHTGINTGLVVTGEVDMER